MKNCTNVSNVTIISVLHVDTMLIFVCEEFIDHVLSKSNYTEHSIIDDHFEPSIKGYKNGMIIMRASADSRLLIFHDNF